MQITKIEVQKKHKNYFNLYVEDDVFLFSITEDTLLHYKISKGSDFSEDELQSIQKYDTAMRCLYQSYRYLNIHPHLASELRRKLRQKKFDEDSITTAISQLKKQKLLKDEQFIASFIHDQIRLKKNGPLIIKQKLFEKGASAAVIEPILQTEYTEELQISNAESLFLKKKNNLNETDNRKLKDKLIRYLQQKGFTWQVIETVLNNNSIADDLTE
jgi:regulatory protein